MRELVVKIPVHSRNAGAPVRFDITGKLIALLDPSAGSVVPREGSSLSHRGTEPQPTFLIRCTG